MNFKVKSKADQSDLDEFESRYLFSLPEEYKDFLKNQNGGRLNGLYVFAEEYVVHAFLGINNKQDHFDLTQEYDELAKMLPKKFLPFALDSGGNYYLINLRSKNYTIYFWDHNLQTEGTRSTGLEKISKSFNTFVNQVKPDKVEIKTEVIRKDGKIILRRID